MLERAGLDPTFVIGGDLNEIGSGARAGDGDLFVAEADESDGSFLLPHAAIGIVTNVEVDHVDFYPGGAAEIEGAFAAFMRALGGRRRVRGRPGRARGGGAGRASRSSVTASAPATTCASSSSATGPGGARGTVAPAGRTRCGSSSPSTARHNMLNAAAALDVAAGLVGVPAADAADALASFQGVRRRFEHRGAARGAEFYDDYGHVPTELAVTLGVARRQRAPAAGGGLPAPPVLADAGVVAGARREPAEADVVVVTDVYGAAQAPIPGVTGKLVVDGVRRGLAAASASCTCRTAPTSRGSSSARSAPGDLVLTMGCGDVWMLGDEALERASGRRR